MTSRAATTLLAGVAAAWDDWLVSLADLPAARVGEAGASGGWSVKDLMGHVAAWEALTLATCGRLLSGESVERVAWRRFNADEAAARRVRSGAEVLAEMERTHERFVAFVGALSDGELRTKGVRSRLRQASVDHYREHAAQVRSWRQRTALDRGGR